MVALPGDTISAVQNAEFTEDQGVVSMTPAPYDLTVTPGNEVTVSIYASGPVRTARRVHLQRRHVPVTSAYRPSSTA